MVRMKMKCWNTGGGFGRFEKSVNIYLFVNIWPLDLLPACGYNPCENQKNPYTLHIVVLH